MRIPFASIACGALAVCMPAFAQRPHTAGPGVDVLAQPLAMPGLQRQRTLRVYLPPSYARGERRYPVIYMHDGQNLFDDATSYAGEWGVDETLDELARTRGFEVIVVGVDNGGERRMQELNPWDQPRFGPGEGAQYMSFVVDVVKPWVDGHYRTRPERQATAIVGSSMGGLISHYAIHRYPQVFGMAGVFSPAYWVAPAMGDYASSHPLPADARVYLYMGGREGSEALDGVQRMHALLAPALPGGRLTLSIDAQAEHNEAAWRGEFARAVAWLFGLPQRPPKESAQ